MIVIGELSCSPSYPIKMYINQYHQGIQLQIHLKKVEVPLPLVPEPAISMKGVLASQPEEGNHSGEVPVC